MPIALVAFLALVAVIATTALLLTARLSRWRSWESGAHTSVPSEDVRRAQEMEQLLNASRTFSAATEFSQLRVEAWRHVPPHVGGRLVWIAACAPHGWQWIIEPDAADASRLLDLAPMLEERAESQPYRHEGWTVFPLRAAGRSVGLMGVPVTPPLRRRETACIATLTGLMGVALRNVQLIEQLQLNSVSDSLTGCFNRAHAFAVLDGELRRARRTRRAVSVLMLDIDDFKAINDEHGHLCGDAVLEGVAGAIHRTLRSSDIKCRYGGDEFLIALPDTPREGAQKVVGNLRGAMERLRFAGRKRAFTPRISIGIATARPDELDVRALVGRADAALYRDKRRDAPSAALVERRDEAAPALELQRLGS